MAVILRNQAGDVLDFTPGGVDLQLDDVALYTPVVFTVSAPTGRRTLAAVTVAAANANVEIASSTSGPWVSNTGGSLDLGVLTDAPVTRYIRQISNVATGTGDNVAVLTVTDPGDEDVPNSPTFSTHPTWSNVTATTARVTFSATDPDEGDTITYKLLVRTTAGTPSLADFAALTQVTSPVDLTGLAGSTTYYATALATDSQGNTTISNVVTQATSAPASNQAPQFTVTPTVGSQSASGYTLSWSMTDAEGDAITVELSTDGGAFSDVTSSVTGTTTKQLAVTGKSAGTTYSEVLRISDAEHPGAAGTSAGAVSCLTLPAAPTGLALTVSPNEIAADWNDTTGASAYDVQTSTDGTNYFDTPSDPTASAQTITAHNGSAFSGIARYYVRVRAKNASGVGAWATPVQSDYVPLQDTFSSLSAWTKEYVAGATATASANRFTLTSSAGEAVYSYNTPGSTVGNALVQMNVYPTTNGVYKVLARTGGTNGVRGYSVIYDRGAQSLRLFYKDSAGVDHQIGTDQTLGATPSSIGIRVAGSGAAASVLVTAFVNGSAHASLTDLTYSGEYKDNGKTGINAVAQSGGISIGAFTVTPL